MLFDFYLSHIHFIYLYVYFGLCRKMRGCNILLVSCIFTRDIEISHALVWIRFLECDIIVGIARVFSMYVHVLYWCVIGFVQLFCNENVYVSRFITVWRVATGAVLNLNNLIAFWKYFLVEGSFINYRFVYGFNWNN